MCYLILRAKRYVNRDWASLWFSILSGICPNKLELFPIVGMLSQQAEASTNFWHAIPIGWGFSRLLGSNLKGTRLQVLQLAVWLFQNTDNSPDFLWFHMSETQKKCWGPTRTPSI
jgi:hypothetical protein